MFSVMKREMRQYFCTPTGYVFIVIFWLLGTAFFFLYNIAQGSSDLSELFGNLSYLFMLLIPLITMSLLSVDRRLKSDVLHFCTPTPLWAIVMGKFLAAAAVLLIALAGTGVYAGVLDWLAGQSAEMLLAYYLGLFLLGACYISVGILMSALTESQVVAAVLTLAANLLLQLAEMIAPSVYIPYLPFISTILKASALNTHYASFASGVIQPTDIGYFILFLTVMLSLTIYVLRRKQLVRR